jgi:phosphate transport system permease protein
MRAMLLFAVVLALVPLALIIFVTLRAGLSAWNVEFFTQVSALSVRRAGGGYLHGIVGTALMVSIATALAVPLGILAAVFLVEYRAHPLAPPIRFFTDVMTGVPSIFVGLFVYAALVLDLDLGFSTLAGAVSLAILMLPIVVRSGEEILKLVPQDLRNAAYGLGARRWQAVVKVVLPAAAPGLVTGSMLAVARAAGETAPLLFTVLGAQEIVTALVGKAQTAVTLLTYEDARRPFAPAQARGWGGALLLMAIVLTFTVIARKISARATVSR